jgi:hypothetical protein
MGGDTPVIIQSHSAIGVPPIVGNRPRPLCSSAAVLLWTWLDASSSIQMNQAHREKGLAGTVEGSGESVWFVYS